MRQVTRKGLITAAATGGWLVLSGGVADADSGAAGTSTASPGALSGNTIQVPVHVPVNVCGNSLNVVGGLSPAFGTTCALGAPGEPGGPGVSGSRGAGRAGAVGEASGSPGVASGNAVQVPVQAPVNVCGNSANVVGAGNVALSGTCANEAPLARPQPAPPAARPSPASGVPESGGRAGQGEAGQGEGGGRGQQVDRPSAAESAPQVPGQREGGGRGQQTDRPNAARPSPASGAPESGGRAGQGEAGQGEGGGRGQQMDRPSAAEPARQVLGGSLRTAHALSVSHRERAGGQLAATGGGPALSATLPLGAGLLTGGVVLYRRAALARRR